MNIDSSNEINPILKYRLARKTTEKSQKFINFQTLAYCSRANFRFQSVAVTFSREFLAGAKMSDTNELLPGTSGASCIAKDEDSAGQDLCGFVDSNGHAYFVDAISRDKFTDREGNEFEFDESENGYYLLKEDGQKAEHFDFDDRNLTLCDTESSILRKSRFLIETMNKRKSSAAISYFAHDNILNLNELEELLALKKKSIKR
uniref:Uncharacterized protein n=1 Tax=Romanomermis culicivorax TaxID=13658 RepID=A0A915IFG8_ROMCU